MDQETQDGTNQPASNMPPTTGAPTDGERCYELWVTANSDLDFDPWDAMDGEDQQMYSNFAKLLLERGAKF